MAKKLYSSDVYGDRIHGQTLDDTIALLAAMRELNGQFKNVARVASSGLNTTQMTSQGIANLGQSYSLLTTIEKERDKVAQEMIRTEAKLVLAMQDETNELIRLKKELDQVNKAKKTNADVTNESIGAYQKAVNTLNQLSKSLKDLAMSEKQNTEQFKEFQKQYSDLYEKVLAADKAVGHFQRNVGNYEMATHRYRYSLFQVQQVLRELPNFAMSARVGFMALSNNLPILADELSKVARSVDENTGKAVGWGNTLKMVAKEMFGWQTLLLVGITMTVQFADEIGNMVSKMVGADKETRALKSSMAMHNYELEKGKQGYVEAASKISEFTEKMKLAKEGRLDEKNVIEDYNKSLGVHLGQVSDLLSLEKALIEQGPAYIKNMMLKAAVEATAKEQAEKRLELEMKIMEKADEINRIRQSNEYLLPGPLQVGTQTYVNSELIALGKLQGELAKTDKAYSKLINNMLSRMGSGTVDYGDWDWGDKDDDKKSKSASGGSPIKAVMNKDQRLQNDLLRWKVEMDRIDQKRRINEIEAEVDATRLKTIAKSAKEESDIERELKESLIRIKIKANEDKLRLLQDPNYVGYDSVEQIAELTAEISKLRAEIDLLNKAASPEGKDTKQAISSEKANAKSFIDIAKALDQYADSRERMQQTRLQNQINATKRRQEELRLLSAQGVKDAKDNLAMEERKQAELERKQEILQRRQQNRQLVLSAMQTYNSKVQSGDKNALQNTITDLSKLIAFASTLPAFIEGTEDGTVADKLGKPQLNTGQDDYIIRVDGREKIFNPADSAKMAGLTNSTIADLAYNYKVGMMPVISGVDDTKPNPIITELRDLKKAVKEQKPPVMMWNDTDKAMEYKYQQGERMVREIHKTTGIFSTR